LLSTFNYSWNSLSPTGGSPFRWVSGVARGRFPTASYWLNLIVSVFSACPPTKRGRARWTRPLRGRVMVRWDELPAPRSGQTREYLEANRSWLRVERLPAYAPELNPVEDLWACITNRATANYSPDTLAELDGQFRTGLRPLRRQTDLGLNLIKHTASSPNKNAWSYAKLSSSLSASVARCSL
jgi:transposase